MRKYSEFEKSIISNIVNKYTGPNQFLTLNIFNDFFYNEKVEWRYGEPNKLYIYRDVNNVDAIDLLSCVEYVINVSVLLDALERDRFITLINCAGDPLQSVAGFVKGNLNRIETDIDPQIGETLKRAASTTIFISQELKELVNNKFETYEEQQLNESKMQTRFARYTLYASIITLIITAIGTIFTSVSPIEIKEKQLKIITSKLDSINVFHNNINKQVMPCTCNNTDTVNIKISE